MEETDLSLIAHYGSLCAPHGYQENYETSWVNWHEGSEQFTVQVAHPIGCPRGARPEFKLSTEGNNGKN